VDCDLDALLPDCERLLAEGNDVDMIIAFLRHNGCSKITCILVVKQLLNVDTRKAKEIVHFSEAWKDTKELDEAFHERLIEFFTEYAKENGGSVTMSEDGWIDITMPLDED
jgi:maltooligosyltrehalose synthase